MQRTHIVLGLVALYITYLIVDSLAKRLHNKAAAKSVGAKPVFTIPRSWTDPLGYFNVKEISEQSRQRKLLDYVYNRYERVSRMAGRDCPTFKFPVLNRSIIFTCDPENVKAVLATQFKDFSLGTVRKNSFFPLLGRGIFTSDGKDWDHSRAMLRPSFARDQVSDLDLEEKHCQNLMKAIPAGADGWTRQVDMQVLFFRLTIDSSTDFLFGQSVNSQLTEMAAEQGRLAELGADTKNEAIFAPAFDTAQRYLANRGRLGHFYFLINNAEFRRSCKICHDFIDHYVRLALSRDLSEPASEKADERYVFLQELARQTQDPIELRSQLLHILLAGRDTTASALGWTFFLLARHPAVFARLRETIVRDFGPYDATTRGAITFAGLKNCQYLQHVLNESLRLFPVVPINARMATKDTVLPRGGGPDGLDSVFVPKGTDVAYSVYTMHHRKALWGADADEFKPERWAGRRSGWEYLPFNGGPRICLGQQFALTSAGFAVVRLLQRFDRIENLDPHGMDDVRQNATLTSCSDRGVQVRLHEAAR